MILTATPKPVKKTQEELDMEIDSYNLGKEEKQGLINTRIVRVVVPKFVERMPLYHSATLSFNGKKHCSCKSNWGVCCNLKSKSLVIVLKVLQRGELI